MARSVCVAAGRVALVALAISLLGDKAAVAIQEGRRALVSACRTSWLLGSSSHPDSVPGESWSLGWGEGAGVNGAGESLGLGGQGC